MLLLQPMDRSSIKCAQLGEITTGRPLTDISISFPPPATTSQPCTAKQATQTSTSSCRAKSPTASPPSPVSNCCWMALRWSSPNSPWLSIRTCKNRHRCTLQRLFLIQNEFVVNTDITNWLDHHWNLKISEDHLCFSRYTLIWCFNHTKKCTDLTNSNIYSLYFFWFLS